MRRILITECQDEQGLIAKITGLCYEHQLNIVKNDEYVDRDNQRFFMRTELAGEVNEQRFVDQLKSLLPDAAHIAFSPGDRKKVVVMATKEAHCLGGLLLKHYEGTINIDIVAVISNYQDLAPLVNGFNIPFHFICHQQKTREQHDNEMATLIDQYQVDYIALAKYMRILSPEFVARYPGQIINIHHSFLPAFIGAKPYHQAWHRGVKIIGATAHFVTTDLDEGPIIEQDVIHVDHSYSVEDMAHSGRDIEKTVFCKAVAMVADQKVMVSNNKTIVFK